MADIAAVTRVDISGTDSTGPAVASAVGGLKSVGDAAVSVESSFKSMAAALGVSLSVAGIVEFTRGIVDAAANLDILSKVTGSSVESLSALQNAAYIAGVPTDRFNTLLERMTSNMETLSPTSTKAAQALAALGVSATDPVQALQEASIALSNFADGAGKASAEKDLFGRSGYEMSAALQAIADASVNAATTTTQQAAASEKLEEDIRRLTVTYGGLKQVILSDVVPTLDQWIDGVTRARAAGLGWSDALTIGTSDPNRLGEGIADATQKVADLTKELQTAKDISAETGTTFGNWIPNLEKDLELAQGVAAAWKNQRLLVAQSMITPSNMDANDLRLANLNAKPQLDYSGATKEQADDVANLTKQLDALNDTIAKNDQLMIAVVPTNVELNKVYADFDQEVQKLAESHKTMTAAESAAWDALAKGAIALDDSNAKLKDYTTWLTAAGKAASDQAKAQETYNQAVQDQVGSLNLAILAAQKEAETVGESSTEKERAKLLQDALNASVLQGGIDADTYASDVAKINAAFDQIEQNQALVKAAAAASEAWKKVDNEIADQFVTMFNDMLTKSTSLLTDLKNFALHLFDDVVLKPLVLSVVTSITGSLSTSVLSNSLGSAGGSIGGNLFTSLFGTVAGAVQPGAAGALGDLTAGSGILGSLGTTLGPALMAAAPYAAIAAIAIPAIFSLFSSSGGPKVGGYAETGPGGSFPGLYGGTGTSGVGGRAYTPSQDDTTVATAVAATLASYNAFITGVGGKGTAQFGLGYDTDPQGTAGNRVTAGASVGGLSAFSVKDLGFSGDVGTELQTVADQALLAALKASELPAAVADMLDAATSFSSDANIQAAITNAQAFGSAYLTVTAALAVSPIAAALDDITAAADPAYLGLKNQATALLTLGAAYTGTAAQSAALATATTSYYAALVAEVATIEQLKTTIATTGAAAIQTIALSVMTPAQQAAYYTTDETKQLKAIGSATNPTDVQTDLTAYLADLKAAFALLTPEQQAAQAKQYEDLITKADDAADKRLTSLEAALQKQANDTLTQIKDVMDEAANTIKNAGTTIAQAVQPLRVSVTGVIVDANGTPVGNFGP